MAVIDLEVARAARRTAWIAPGEETHADATDSAWKAVLSGHVVLDGEDVDALGGWRGRLGIMLATAAVAFPMSSGLVPAVAHWVHAISPGDVLLGSAILWIGALLWVLHGVARDLAACRKPARAARTAAEYPRVTAAAPVAAAPALRTSAQLTRSFGQTPV